MRVLRCEEKREAAQSKWVALWTGCLKLESLLFYLLVFSTVAFSKDFAYLHLIFSPAWPYMRLASKPLADPSFAAHGQIGGLSVYATEIFLAVIVGAIFVRRWQNRDFVVSRTSLDGWFAAWFLLGVGQVILGVFRFGDLSLALRDFGMVYYVIFFYLVGEICHDWRDVQRLMAIFCAGTILRIAIANHHYILHHNFLPGVGIDWPSLEQYMSGTSGFYLLLPLLVGIAFQQSLCGTRRWLLLAYLSIGTFTLTLAQQRSLFLALLLGIIVLMVWARVFNAPVSRAGLAGIFAGAVLTGTLLWLLRINFGPASAASLAAPIKTLWVKTGSTAITRGVSEIELIGTARFRQDAWEEAWRRFSANPILGEGFGNKFVFYDTGQKKWWTKDVRPHNTYLTVLYKMGIVGIAILGVVHWAFYRVVYQALRAKRSSTMQSHLLGFTAAFVAVQAYGFLNLLLESPFLALVYWSLMGVIFVLAHLGGGLQTKPA